MLNPMRKESFLHKQVKSYMRKMGFQEVSSNVFETDKLPGYYVECLQVLDDETKVSVLSGNLYRGKYQVFFEHTVNELPCFISETVSEYGGGFIDWSDV
jgi:hypothetical protein